MFTTDNFHKSWEMKQALISINRRMDNSSAVHIHNGILFSYKEKWNNKNFKETDRLENVILSKLTQVQEIKPCIFLSHM